MASCSYDGKVIIWKEQTGTAGATWSKIKEHTLHVASGACNHSISVLHRCLRESSQLRILGTTRTGSYPRLRVVRRQDLRFDFQK